MASGTHPAESTSRGRELNTNTSFSNFSGTPGIPAKIPGYPAKKFGFPGFRRTYRTFWPPTPSHGRPPPHPKISGQKKFGFGLFFFPELHERLCKEFGRASSYSFYATMPKLALLEPHIKWPTPRFHAKHVKCCVVRPKHSKCNFLMPNGLHEKYVMSPKSMYVIF